MTVHYLNYLNAYILTWSFCLQYCLFSKRIKSSFTIFGDENTCRVLNLHVKYFGIGCRKSPNITQGKSYNSHRSADAAFSLDPHDSRH